MALHLRRIILDMNLIQIFAILCFCFFIIPEQSFAQNYQTEFHRLIQQEEFKLGINSIPEISSEKEKFSKVIFKTGFGGGDFYMRSNQDYINSLVVNRGSFYWELELYPLKNFGIGGSLNSSSLHDMTGEHPINGRSNSKEVYAIIRTGPFDENMGFIGFYYGLGKNDDVLIEIDPEFTESSVRGMGYSNFFGVILQYFGKSSLGFSLDASFREYTVPQYNFVKSGEEFLTLSEIPQVMNSSLKGFNLKIGLALRLF